MRKINIFHPVIVFVGSLSALGTSLYLYIDSYIRVNDTLSNFIKKSGLPKTQFKEPQTWIMILTMSILAAAIVVGLTLVFVYYQKVIQLYRMQQNFINGFTHELKTPIASLRLFIDTFKKYEIPREKQIEYLDLMQRDTERMQENVELILNLARIEDKSFKPEVVKLDLYNCLDELLKKNSHIFEDVEISVGKKLEDSIVNFDKKLLDVVLMNILVNARRYNDNDNKNIDIYFNDHVTNIELTIKDNGHGIKRENLKNVFKKFFQVGKSAKGSGLGLYMVSQVMRIHKGRVSASSEGIGKGSSFHLFFSKKELS